MIDLEKFNTTKIVIMPIVDGWGQIETRKIYVPALEDGWYRVSLGDEIKIVNKATRLEIIKTLQPLKKYRIYAFGTEGIPISFDIFNRLGFKETEHINFLSCPIFSVVDIVLWEDGRFYFVGEILPKNRKILTNVREAFESELTLDNIKGVTPEIRYYYLLLNLQRESAKALEELKAWTLSQEEYKKRVEAFKLTFSSRLKDAVRAAGGQLVRYNKIGQNYMVEWKIGGQTVKSTIRDDMRIISAGFCLNSQDKLHTLSSITHLAKMFQSNAPLYITRQ